MSAQQKRPSQIVMQGPDAPDPGIRNHKAANPKTEGMCELSAESCLRPTSLPPNRAWREKNGEFTKMAKMGCGGIQFCSDHCYGNGGLGIDKCSIYLLGAIVVPCGKPVALEAATLDGTAPFSLVWDRMQRCNLGHLNYGFVCQAVQMREVVVIWRPDYLCQNLENQFVIPVRTACG